MDKKHLKKISTLLAVFFTLVLFAAVPVSAASKPTTYKGTNYKAVYNYDYYMSWLKSKKPSVYKTLKNKSGKDVLAYFVKTGMKSKHRGNDAFDVVSYYNANPGLRYSYEQDWAKYYTYYIKHPKGKVASCPQLKGVITTYKYNNKWVQLSSVYDFEYFTKHNSSAYKYWKSQNDAGAVKYFVSYGLLKGWTAKEGVTSKSKAYKTIYNKLHPSSVASVDKKAAEIKSSTKYLILVNQGKHRTYIYKGSKNNWHRIHTFECGTGRNGTRTPNGTFHIQDRGLYFNTNGNARCWYWSRFKGNYLFHSMTYYKSSRPTRLMGARNTQIGYVSHGCIRLDIQNAIWIYKNIPRGTKVVIYNRT